MKLKPHHVGLTVNNIDESVTWYKEMFGAGLIQRSENGDMKIALIQFGNVRLELFSFDTTKELPEYRKDLMDDLHEIGTKHLSIEVEDLENTVQDLKKKNVEFITEIDTAFFGGRYIFFKDCNGIVIELYEGK